MKKILFLSILLVVLFVTGCSSQSVLDGPIGVDITPTPTTKPTKTPRPTATPSNNKRLVCNQKVQTVDVDMIADFSNSKLTYLGLKYEMDLSDYTDAQITAIKAQDMCSVVSASMQNYTSAFRNCKQSVSNKTLLITADFDLNKIAGADLSSNTSITEAKTELEKQNYVCTITNR